MGDGFICTVGFPFAVDISINESAVRLAERLVLCFQDRVAHHFGDQKLYCSMGIAYGEVFGMFKSVGIKNYDLYGEAIIRATRYESMRRVLQNRQAIDRGDTIILQAQVGEDAAVLRHNNYQKLELLNISVRNDDEARHLYYRIIPTRKGPVSQRTG